MDPSRRGRLVLPVLPRLADVAEDGDGLANPGAPGSASYPALDRGALVTPDWTFACTDLRRFPEGAHPSREETQPGSGGDHDRVGSGGRTSWMR